MKFYIASGFRNKALVKYVNLKLTSIGSTCTYDWTINDRAITPAQLHRIGTLEQSAIAACDLFILLLPAGKGSHVELGMALAYGKRVYIYAEAEIDLMTASTFYFVDGVQRIYGKVDDFIEGIGLV